MSKKLIRPWAVGLMCAMGSLGLSFLGAQEVPVYTNAPANPIAPAEGDDQEEGKEAQPNATGEASTNTPPRLVQAATTPPEMEVSPALAEVIRLVQAGVAEEVLLSYITNSTQVYNFGSEEIVYLNDLGVSSRVLTALIERDNTPDALEQKRLAKAANPLPEGVAINKPATNIFLAGTPAAESTEGPTPTTEAVPPPEETRVAEPVETGDTAQPAAASGYFYDSLAPYGNWVQVENYGLCWQPTVAVVNAGWRPYGDRGRWLWTTSGWYWYSDYTWGWAPFHYGRWYRSPACGWVWVPGTVWGPSWVTWRYSDAYCGWAPLPPYTYYSAGFGLAYHHDSVHFGFGFGFGFNHYIFAPWGHFCDYYPYHHYVHGHHASVIFKDTVAVNNFTRRPNGTIVNHGFGRELAARRSRQNIDEVVVRPGSRPGGGGRPERLVQEGRTRAIVRPQFISGSAAGSLGSAGDATRTGAGRNASVEGRSRGPRMFQSTPSDSPSRSSGVAGSSSGVARPFSGGAGFPARTFHRNNNTGAGSTGSGGSTVTGNSSSVARSPVQVAPGSQGANDDGAAVSRPSQPTAPTRSPNAGRVTRPNASPNTQLRSVYTPPPSAITRPPSVITQPPSVNTRPPSAITRPPSAITRPPSIGSRPMTRSVPVFPGSPAARPNLAPPSPSFRAPSAPSFNRPSSAPVFRAPPASISRPPPTMSRPPSSISRPPAGGGGGVSRGSGPSGRGAGRGRGDH